ncbi:hypothetical protein GCM10022282_12510 [Agromyces indicus]
MHARDEAVEQTDGIVDHGVVVRVDAVQQPARELELAVEQRAPCQFGVGEPGASGHVCGQGLLGRGARGGEHPVEVACGVVLREAGPAEHARHAVALDEERVGAELSVDDGGGEPPQRVVVGGLLPAAHERRREPPGVRRAVDDLDGRLAGLLRRAPRKPRLADEARGKRVDRGDRPADLGRERRGGREVVRRAHRAGDELGDDRPSGADRRLADELGHRERQARADAGGQGAQPDEVGGLLVLGGGRARDADQQPPTVGGVEFDGIERARHPVGVRPGRPHLESRHRGRGQRG